MTVQDANQDQYKQLIFIFELLETYFVSMPHQQQYVYNTIVIRGSTDLLQCISGKVIVTNPNVNNSWQLTSSTGDIILSTKQSRLIIPAYTATAGSSYNLNFTAISHNLSSTSSYNLTFIEQPLQIIIQGGDKTIGVTDILSIQPLIYDPNKSIQALQNLSTYSLKWNCFDTARKTDCTDRNSMNLDLNSSVNGSLTYPGMTFSSYSSYHFNLTVTDTLGNLSTGLIKISVVKNVISTISLNLISDLPFQKVNIYQPQQFEFLTQNYLDSQIYQLAIQYQGQVVKTLDLSYPQFSIKLFDALPVFNSFSPSTITIVGFVSSGNQMIPSISTLQLHINPPPHNCQIKITPKLGISLSTLFTFSIFGCISQDLPLSYRYFYYDHADTYHSDRAMNSYSNALALTNIASYAQFTTILATNSESRTKLFLLVQVRDSLGEYVYISKSILLDPIKDLNLGSLVDKLTSTTNFGDQIRLFNVINSGLGHTISVPNVTIIKLNMISQIQVLLKKTLDLEELNQLQQTMALILLNSDVMKSFDSVQVQTILNSIESQISILQNHSQTLNQSQHLVSIMTSLSSQISSIIGKNQLSISDSQLNQNPLSWAIADQNVKILQIIDSIINYLTTPLYPNGPPIKIIQPNFKFETSFVNKQGLSAITGVDLLDMQQTVNGFRMLQDSQLFYSYRLVVFNYNLKSTGLFPYPSQNTSLIQMRITQQNQSYFIQDSTANDIIIQQPLSLKLTTSQATSDARSTCISQSLTANWTNKSCNTLSSSSGSVWCICTQLGYFSVVDDINGIYKQKAVVKVSQSIAWQKIIFFIFYALLTCFYIAIIVTGYYKDISGSLKVYPYQTEDTMQKIEMTSPEPELLSVSVLPQKIEMISPEPELLNASVLPQKIGMISTEPELLNASVFQSKLFSKLEIYRPRLKVKSFQDFFVSQQYLLNCITVYDQKISRPARSTTNFSCFMISITMAVFFGSTLTFVRVSLIAIMTSILNIAFTGMFHLLFKQQILKKSGFFILLVVDVLLLVVFIVVTVESPAQAFQAYEIQFWASFLTDNMIIQTIKIIIQYLK